MNSRAKVLVAVQFGGLALFLSSILPGLGLPLNLVTWVYSRKVGVAVILCFWLTPRALRIISTVMGLYEPWMVVAAVPIVCLNTVLTTWWTSKPLGRMLDGRGLLD